MGELERMGRLKRFLSPQVADADSSLTVLPKPGVMDPVALTVAGALTRAGLVPGGGELYVSTGGSVLRFESASDCEPPDSIFADGFESGDTSAWSSVVP